MQPNQFEKLVRGQQRLEVGMSDVRKSLDKLSAAFQQFGAAAAMTATITAADGNGSRENASSVVVKSPSQGDNLGNLGREVSGPILPVVGHYSSVRSSKSSPQRTCFNIEHTSTECPSVMDEPFRHVSTREGHRRPSIGTDYGSRGSATSALAARSAVLSSLTFRPRAVLAEVQQGICSEELHEWSSFMRSFNAQEVCGNGDDGEATRVVGAGLQTYDGSWLILHPLSSFITFLDILRMLFMMIDMALVPYMLALNKDEHSGSLLVVGWVIVSFWTFDLLFNLRTGFISGGRVVTKWSAILLRYLRRGFTFDVTVLSVDYLDVLASSLANSSAGLPQTLRFLKALRLVRFVVRIKAGLLTRLKTSLFHGLQHHGFGRSTQSMELAIIMLNVFVLIAWLSHMGSCIWSAMELRATDAEKAAWEDYDTGSMDSYPRALYWSVSTMFAGSSPVLPKTTGAGCLAVTWIVLGAVFVTSVTSMLAASIIEQQQKQQEMNKKAQILNSFLSQCQTPTLLSVAVLDDFSKKVLEPKPVTESDMPFLVMVKPTLRAALREHRYGTAFYGNDVLRMLCVIHEPLLQQLCFTASNVAAFPIGEEVFEEGDEMDHSLLLTDGQAEYTFLRSSTLPALSSRRSIGNGSNRSSRQDSDSEPLAVEHVAADQWICELAILINWTTVGTLITRSQCELLKLSADEFLKVLVNHPQLMVVTAQYAAVLAASLTELVRQPVVTQKLPFTDINPGVDCDEIISNMSHILRGLVSRPLLDMLRRHQRVLGGVLAARKAFADLETEVRKGKCHLSIGVDGISSIGRVVRIVVLQLTNQEGLMCVQIAESKGRDKIIPKFGLPGRKVRGAETTEEAAQEMIKEQLHTLGHALSNVAGVEIVTESSYSDSYGMWTKYIKTIFKLKLMGYFTKQRKSELDAALWPIDSLTVSAEITAIPDRNVPEVTASRNTPQRDRNTTALPARRQLLGLRRHQAAAQGSQSQELQDSHRDDLISRECGQKMDSDGVHHGFAVPAAADSPGGAGEDLQSEDTSRWDPLDKCFYLYRWLSESQYASLLQRKSEVELALQPVLKGLNMAQWQQVFSWKLQTYDKDKDGSDAQPSVARTTSFRIESELVDGQQWKFPDAKDEEEPVAFQIVL
mmetsp:Transcript_30545/g.71319  ORF Transcript_30545/g.71319 Transcript_30545/m.71319 type:complete len:1137 (+) Transcript_30545:102-3512(+)